MHQTITSAKGQRAPKAIRLDDEFQGDASSYIAGTLRDELEAATNEGYLRLNAAGTYYRATVKGAFLMTWKQLQPVKFFVHRTRDRNAKRTLADAGLG